MFTVHTPDLPGHGRNHEDPDRLTLARYATWLTDFIKSLNEPVILAGHSMAGLVISQAAENRPDLIQRLVYLSAYLPGNRQSLFDLIAANHQAIDPAPIESIMTMSQDNRRCGIPAEQIKSLFYNRCPPSRSHLIPSEFPEEAALPLSGKVRLTPENYGRIPRTYISCLDDQVIPVTHQRQMLRTIHCDEMIQLDADHSPFLSCPDMLAALLKAIADKV
jgi:pimeloyl-ACP methyl ester carboxylesterase